MRLKPIEWTRRGECIVVTSHKPTKAGYVVICRNGKSGQYLHRLVCERRHGDLGDKFATHSCDTPACINPDHLIPDSQAGNQAQMARRKRSALGEKNGHSKLTEAQVAEIRKSSWSKKAIMLQFGISRSQITRIQSGKSWK